ncbi:alpha/beta hydrolase [Sphingobium olei]|uniref:Alpha/beta hydrolase n=1 Tax=Sphingobium olei TaxID=420955 RepID=A0ABW3NYB4_9SPHN
MGTTKFAEMRYQRGFLVAILLSQSLAAGCGEAEVSNPARKYTAFPTMAERSPDGRREGIWQPPKGFKQVQIWPGQAPNMEGIDLPPEYTETKTNPDRFSGLPVTGVYNVSKPTMTVFPAKTKGNGTAMLVFSGGGFMDLAIDLEGTEVCDWMTSKGVACILVKYRVPKSNHYGDPECKCGVTPKHLLALQDAQRAIRLVRSQATGLGINPNKIGVASVNVV